MDWYMSAQDRAREEALASLDEAVDEAVAFFSRADEGLWDGHETVREVLSRLLFWHREYVRVAQALLEGREPELKQGTFACWNAAAVAEFEGKSLAELAGSLADWQARLERVLRLLPDWCINFPVKQDSRCWSVAARIHTIERQLRRQVGRLKRAERHGEAWVRAYYM